MHIKIMNDEFTRAGFFFLNPWRESLAIQNNQVCY